MRTKQHYEKMLGENPNTTIGYTLAADMVFAARHGVINRAEDRGGDEWRHIATDLKNRYGENLSVEQVRADMAVDERDTAIIIRNIPESTRRNLKARAAQEGRSMNAVVIELITKYVSD